VTDSPETRPHDQPPIANEAAAGTAETVDELQLGFFGNPKIKLDERNRLKMPTEFKTFIERKYGKEFNAFYITSQDGGSAEIYPLPEWQQRVAKIQTLPPSHAVRVKLMALNNLYGGRGDMDSQGRMSFPEELQQTAELTGEVKVLGEGTFLRVTSLKKLREAVKANPLTAEEIDSLAALGL
jgi:DNA-binding transcriptional regulator/RsmH inhibitor MraZ